MYSNHRCLRFMSLVVLVLVTLLHMLVCYAVVVVVVLCGIADAVVASRIVVDYVVTVICDYKCWCELGCCYFRLCW